MTLLVRGAVRPFLGEDVSGDAWTSFETDGGIRVILIDGAGHGPLANDAAETAKAVLHELAAQPADAALRACHTRLHGTRGAVISIADITAESISFTGVGNVDGRLFMPHRSQQRLSPDRGLLSAMLPGRLHTWTLPLESEDWRLILFSDGVMQRMSVEWEDLSDLSSPDTLLASLLERWGRQTDDASIVIAGHV